MKYFLPMLLILVCFSSTRDLQIARYPDSQFTPRSYQSQERRYDDSIYKIDNNYQDYNNSQYRINR